MHTHILDKKGHGVWMLNSGQKLPLLLSIAHHAQSPWQPITFRQDLPQSHYSPNCAAKAVAWLAKNWFLHAIYFSHYEATDPTLGTKQESLSFQIIIFQNSNAFSFFCFLPNGNFCASIHWSSKLLETTSSKEKVEKLWLFSNKFHHLSSIPSTLLLLEKEIKS